MSFKILCDTREQKVLEFKAGVFDEVVMEALPFGDYWLEISGVQVPYCFERKGFGDLYGTMTGGYPRFKRELERVKENKFTMELLIEGSMREVAAGYLHSKFPGDSMLQKLATLHMRYGLAYHFFEDRRSMARYIEETFKAIKRNFKKDES